MIWRILRLIGVTSELLEPEEAAGQLLEKEVTITWRPAIVEKANERTPSLPEIRRDERTQRSLTAAADPARAVLPLPLSEEEQAVRRKSRAELFGRAGTLPPEGADEPADLRRDVRVHARKRAR